MANLRSGIRSALQLFLFFELWMVQGAPDNAGKEFVIGFMQNAPFDSGDEQAIELFITTSSHNTVHVTVSAPRANLNGVQFHTEFSVTSGEVKKINVDNGLEHKGTELASKGIVVNASEEIVLYGLNRKSKTTDGYLGLPTDVLGTEYVTVSFSPEYTMLLVVAIENGSDVSILLPNNADVSVKCMQTTYHKNEWINVTMNRFDSLQITSTSSDKGDLTGAHVISNRKLSVFSGNMRALVTYTNSRDHLVEQLFPVSTWGKSFATVPIPERTVGDMFRFVTCEENTSIIVYQNQRGSIFSDTLHVPEARGFIERDIGSDVYSHIVSDKPIIVTQFVKSQSDKSEPADPSMILIPPIEQYAADYTFATPRPSTGTYHNYIIFVLSKSELSGLRLNNKHLPIDTKYNDIPHTNPPLVGGFVKLQDGIYTLKHESPVSLFSALLFGLQDRESYAYPAGTRLAPINEPCYPTSMSPGDGIDNDCDGKIDEEICYPSMTDNDQDQHFNEDCAKSNHKTAKTEKTTTAKTTTEKTTAAKTTTEKTTAAKTTTEKTTAAKTTTENTTAAKTTTEKTTAAKTTTEKTTRKVPFPWTGTQSTADMSTSVQSPLELPSWFQELEGAVILLISLVVVGGGVCLCKRFCLGGDDSDDDDDEDVQKYPQRRRDPKFKVPLKSMNF